jgi:hypothetical protein
MLECIEVVFMYVGSKLSCVFIFNEVTWFFPSIVYLCESINRAISYTRWWDMHGWMPFVHVFVHHAALYSFVFPFHSLLDIRKNKRLYLYNTILLPGKFFLSPVGLLPSVSQYFCSSDSIRIHHVFSSLQFILSFCFLLILLWSIDLCMHIYKIVVFLFSSNKHLLKQYNFKKKKKSITT